MTRMEQLASWDLPRLKRLEILTRHMLSDIDFFDTMRVGILARHGPKPEWDLPAAAVSVHEDLVKLIAQKENELEPGHVGHRDRPHSKGGPEDIKG